MLGKTILSIFGIALCFYLALLTYMYSFQEKLLFPGTPLPVDYQFQFDLPFEERTIAVENGELNALHFQQHDPKGVIFFLHGNGGNLVDWTANIDWYQRNNYDLFIFDYRGYGKSTGEITSQQQLIDDVRAAWREMNKHYQDKPIIIYGRSLGSALAAHLAPEVEAEMVILVSPFTSMLAMVDHHYPYVPGFLLRYALRTDEIIGNIQQKLILIHGDQDQLIPLHHSQQLLEQAHYSTRLLTIEGANHNNIHQFPSYLQGLSQVLPN